MIMGRTRYELDAKGDILLSVYNVPYDLPQDWRELDGDLLAGFREPSKTSKPVNGPADGETKEEYGDLETHDQSILQIRASSKHLTLSCPQVERTLQQGFREGNELQSAGCLELPIEDWEAMSSLILMLIIHGRTRAVPRKISLKRLSEMAVLVDYYECYEAVEVFSDMWIDMEQRHVSRISNIIDAEIWLFISWVFQRGAMFQKSSHFLQRYGKEKLLTKELPIPGHVRGELIIHSRPITGLVLFINELMMDIVAIDESRENAIRTIVQYLNDIIADLQNKNTICDYECDCIMLGALTKHMHRMKILSPMPNPNVEGRSFAKLKFDVGEMKYPTLYNGNTIFSHECRLSLQSKINSLLDSTDAALKNLDIQSFTKPQEP